MEGITINDVYYGPDVVFPDVFRENEELASFLLDWFNEKEYVLGHTSGSTGSPKEIRLLKRDMIASAKITNDFFHLSATDNLWLPLSPAYIAGKMMLVRAWLAGANICVVKPAALPQIPADKTFSLAAMVPMQVQEILASELVLKQFCQIKQLIIGGAPVSLALQNALQQVSVNCFATYGMTETVSHIALKQLNGKEASDEYFALGNVWFETDARNCLVIHAPHLQQACFVTNDIVRLRDARHFEWVGRYDHVINSGGVKLSPEVIEMRLSALITSRFFITSMPDERLGEKVVLVIEGDAWSSDRLQELKHGFISCLQKYEIPQAILFRKAFCETYSGKIVRKI